MSGELRDLKPLFICSFVGSVIATRYIWHLIKPAYNLENYEEPQIFGFQPFHTRWTPMYPKMNKDAGSKSDAVETLDAGNKSDAVETLNK